MQSMLNRICKVYYYNFFKKDPCKKCLVKPMCKIVCYDKSEWDSYTDFGENKTAFQVFNLVAILYGIMMLFFYISRFIMYIRI